MMNEIRKFTRTDWDCWAGAEAFSENSQPLIYTRQLNGGEVEMNIIADRTGIQISFTSSDVEEAMICYTKEMPLNSIRAEGELKQLALYLEAYTYAPDITYLLDHPDHTVVQGYTGTLA